MEIARFFSDNYGCDLIKVILAQNQQQYLLRLKAMNVEVFALTTVKTTSMRFGYILRFIDLMM